MACADYAAISQHPYLGFVHNSNPPCNHRGTNQAGFRTGAFPLWRDDSVFTILVLGGSVASMFAQNPGARLEDVLNPSYRKDGKRFRVLNGAIAAWKQPQQLITLLLYGHRVDGVISIEGFNELAMSRSHDYRQGLEKPWYKTYLAVNPEDISRDYAMYLALNEKLVTATKTNVLLSRSKLLYFMTHQLRRILAGNAEQALESEPMGQTISTFFSVPENWSRTQAKNYYFDTYKHYIRKFDALARGMELDRALFIQPVPAIGKRLTEEERKVVRRLDYKNEYLEQRRHLLSLRDEGVPIFSLLDLYDDTEESLYMDVIHHDKDSIAHKLMAERIAATLASAWALEPASAETSP
jgi:hypothetical protein